MKDNIQERDWFIPKQEIAEHITDNICTPFVCSNCKKVWEASKAQKGKCTPTVYHIDFPTYGLERKICKLCEDMNETGKEDEQEETVDVEDSNKTSY